MNESEALVQLQIFAAYDTDPCLAVEELLAVLRNYREEDDSYTVEGVKSAVADAWDIKTNRCTDRHAFDANGRGMSVEQTKAHCEERARYYRRRLGVRVA